MPILKPSNHAAKLHVPGGREVYAEIIPFTYETALAFLDPEASPKNRPKKMSRIAKYESDLKAGIWPFTGQPLIVSNQGHLIDGQHRAEARVKAGPTSIDPPVMIIYGVDEEVFPFLDNLAPRTSSDALAVVGFKNYRTLSSACGFMIREGRAETETRAATHSEAIEVAKAHPGLHDSIEFILSHPECKRLLTPGLGAYAHYRAGQINGDKRDEFFARIEDGQNLAKGNPIYTLRDQLLKERDPRSKVRYKIPHRLALVIKAFNHFRCGNQVDLVTFRSGELYPKWGDTPANPGGGSDDAFEQRSCRVCRAKGHNARTCPQNQARPEAEPLQQSA